MVSLTHVRGPRAAVDNLLRMSMLQKAQSTIDYQPNYPSHPLLSCFGVFTTAAVSTGSVDDDSAAEPTGEVTASPALEEVQQEQEVEEEGAQTETLGKEYGKGTHSFF